MSKIKPCFWFNKQAPEAAEFYKSVLPDTRIEAREDAAGDFPDGHKGDPLLIEMTLVGMPVTFLNAGPHFTFNEAISFQLFCDDQAEVDRYWEALCANPESAQCGWTKDRFGLSWQIIPRRYVELMKGSDGLAQERIMKAMLRMKKLDIVELEKAAATSDSIST